MDHPPSAPDQPAVLPKGSGVILPPHYGVGLGVLVLALAALALVPAWPPSLWLCLTLGLLGLFLVLQTALLRLEVQDGELVVWRQDSLLRRFPYGAWLSWRLFWPGLPVIFYFREERSIHLLPMLFNAKALSQQLEHHLSHLATSDA